MHKKKWEVSIETLEKWSHEIVYYWETHLPESSHLGTQNSTLKSKEYRSKRIAFISWKKFAEDNTISDFTVFDAHKASALS
jgi:hypothetical protein